jgi:hypothetical protein
MMRKTLLGLVLTGLLSMTVTAVAQVKPTAPKEPEGMVSLFNGKDLTGWEGDPKLWSVKDGAIRGESTAANPCKSNTFVIWQGGKVKDFELRLSARIDYNSTGHGNSGIQYRSKHLVNHKDNKWVVAGYQAEVASEPKTAGFLYDEKGRASLCRVGDKVEVGEDGKPQVVGSLGDINEIAKSYKMKDWNDYVIICQGNHVRQYVNGVQTVDVIDNDLKGQLLSGILALQIHAGPAMVVEFKDIRLKKYDSTTK